MFRILRFPVCQRQSELFTQPLKLPLNRSCVERGGNPVEDTMREMEQLIALLFPKEGPKLMDLKFFQGESPVKVEEFCEAAHAAFVQVDSGQSTPTKTFPEELNRVPVDKFLANAS